MPKKETLMGMARCKRKDGKIADYYVHRMGGGVVIIGPNLERYRCHPEVTNADAAQIEIARVCHVEVISMTDGPWNIRALSPVPATVYDLAPPRGDQGQWYAVPMTCEEIEKRMDELAQKYVETHDRNIIEELYRLSRQLQELEKHSRR